MKSTFFFCHHAVLLLWIFPVYSWMHPKCRVYNSEHSLETVCMDTKDYRAECVNVTNIEKDLPGLPTAIRTLCIVMKPGKYGSLYMGLLSQFQDLENLDIYGCFTEILPTGSSHGLPGLHNLYLEGSESEGCEGFFTRKSFSDLVNLKSFGLSGYRLSVMAQDVFSGMPNLQHLSISEPVFPDLSVLVCRLLDMQSLRTLYIDSNIQLVKRVTFSDCNTTISKWPVLENLTSVELRLGDIKLMDEGSFTWLQNVSYMFFSGSFSNDILLRLPQSGIKKIQHLDYSTINAEGIDFESICHIVFTMSVSKLWLLYKDNSSIFSESNIEPCQGLEYMSLDALRHPVSPGFHLNFIFSLRNLAELQVTSQGNRPDLAYFCFFQPQLIPWLKKVILSMTNLTTLVKDQFRCLNNLLYLELISDQISNIEDFAFHGMSKLQYLDLRFNKIEVIRFNTFYGLHQLTWVGLTDNPLVNVEAMSFTHLRSLSRISLEIFNYPLSPTSPEIKLNISNIFGPVLSQLSQLSLSSGLKPMLLTIGSDITSQHNLSLELTGQMVSFEDCSRPFFKSVVHLSVKAEQFICRSEFMVKYFRSLESFVYISKLSAKTVDLSKINQLVHLKKLVLKRVDLSKQNSADTVFHNLTKLEFLHLSECRINMLEGTLTKDLKSVRTISLWMINTYNILFSFTEHLSSLEYLSVNNLEIFCSCENAWFIEWAKTQRQVEVLMLSPPIMEELTCLSDNGLDKPNFVKYSEAMCTTEYGFVLFASTGLGVSAFMILVLFHRLAGPYLLPLYHITLAWLSEAMRSKRRRRYHYDAFVSYSGKDERWVVEELLPNLEQRGPPFLRLCLHSRDFQLGKDIVENITDSLYQSRHTVCLVSRRYLKSKWCSLEMRLATYRLQAERRDVLILVFLEKISPRQLSTHHRLARLVKTRTYLDWPHDPGQHKAFWDRLWAKLRPATEG